MKLTQSLLLITCAVMVCQCKTVTEEDKASEKKTKEEKPAPAVSDSGMDLSFLLSMSYAEACKITKSKAELRDMRVAADNIEIIKIGPNGKPSKLRAKGQVFLEISQPNGERATAFAQEALVSNFEAILRGRPLLQRGNSLLEGVNDSTVFYIFGSELRVLGIHRATTAEEMVSESEQQTQKDKKQKDSSSKPVGKFSTKDLGLPSWQEGWQNGPNPLLPPLDSSVVPDAVRKSAQGDSLLPLEYEPLPEADSPPATEPAAKEKSEKPLPVGPPAPDAMPQDKKP
jgi:hypothetical protein